MGCSASQSAKVNEQINEVARQAKALATDHTPAEKKAKSRKSSSSSSSSSSESVKSYNLELNKKTVVTKEIVLDFQRITQQIQVLERKKTSYLLESALKKEESVNEDLLELEEKYKVLQANTEKEYADVVSLKDLKESESFSQYFGTTEHFDQQLSKEEQEYVQARSEEENCHVQLCDVRKEKVKVTSEIEELTMEKQHLAALYDKRDNILERVFDGEYGSKLEQSLEEESDELEHKLERLELVLQQWSQAEATCEAACRQLDYACRRWKDVMKITNSSYAMTRMQAMTESRNHLLAAQRNLVQVHKLVSPVRVPYCDKSETDTLGKAISYIFIDGMSHDRQHHALHVYRTTQQRSVVLLRWITAVKTNKILSDVRDTREAYAGVNTKLKKERLRLMVVKVEQETGESLRLDVEEEEEVEETKPAIPAIVVVEAEKINESELDEKVKLATTSSSVVATNVTSTTNVVSTGAVSGKLVLNGAACVTSTVSNNSVLIAGNSSNDVFTAGNSANDVASLSNDISTTDNSADVSSTACNSSNDVLIAGNSANDAISTDDTQADVVLNEAINANDDNSTGAVSADSNSTVGVVLTGDNVADDNSPANVDSNDLTTADGDISNDGATDKETNNVATPDCGDGDGTKSVEKISEEDVGDLAAVVLGGETPSQETGEKLQQGEKPKSYEELAPQPTKEELFGDLDSIMDAYRDQQETLVREREAARERQQESFQEKLRRRRSRKMKQQAAQRAAKDSRRKSITSMVSDE